jgi:AcrR family transcriptional regulator
MKKKTARRKRPLLTKADIVSAGLSILQRKGYDALTIRNVAAALGVKSASLYWHFQAKEELEDELADELLAGFEPEVSESETWQDQLRNSAIGFYRYLKSKRDASRLLMGRFLTGPNAVREIERGLHLFRNAGFSAHDAAFASHAVRVYVQGFVTFEHAPLSALEKKGMPRTNILSQTRKRLSSLSAADFPNIVSSAAELTSPDQGQRFLFGLECLIKGLEFRLQTTTSESQASTH